MSAIQLNGATSGSVTLTPPAVAGTNTLTLPAKTGNIITSADSGTVTQTMLSTNVAGNGPAFSAYANASQTVSSNVFTKISLQVKDFDTASAFDNTTNYRFQPSTAGYYQVNGQLLLVGTVSTTQGIVALYKNGSIYSRLTDLNPSAALSSNSSVTINGSTLIYLNGTDYIELYGYYYLGTSTFSQAGSSSITSRFSGSLVRSA